MPVPNRPTDSGADGTGVAAKGWAGPVRHCGPRTAQMKKFSLKIKTSMKSLHFHDIFHDNLQTRFWIRSLPWKKPKSMMWQEFIKTMNSEVPRRVCTWIHKHEFIFSYMNSYTNSGMKQILWIHTRIHTRISSWIHNFICEYSKCELIYEFIY